MSLCEISKIIEPIAKYKISTDSKEMMFKKLHKKPYCFDNVHVIVLILTPKKLTLTEFYKFVI